MGLYLAFFSRVFKQVRACSKKYEMKVLARVEALLYIPHSIYIQCIHATRTHHQSHTARPSLRRQLLTLHTPPPPRPRAAPSPFSSCRMPCFRRQQRKTAPSSSPNSTRLTVHLPLERFPCKVGHTYLDIYSICMSRTRCILSARDTLAHQDRSAAAAPPPPCASAATC